MRDDSFISEWLKITPCSKEQADCIIMKMKQQEKRCSLCRNCTGPECDIFTTCKEEASLGKFLIKQAMEANFYESLAADIL